MLLRIALGYLLVTCACRQFFSVSALDADSDGWRIINTPYLICDEKLMQSREALVTGGSLLLRQVVYNQYMEYPDGPFVFCFENIPTSPDATAAHMVLSIHPYLPHAPLEDLVNDSKADAMISYFELKKKTLLDNLGSKGDFYNFTEPFDQSQSTPTNTITLSTKLQSFVGFVDTTNDGQINCNCQYTGISDTGRYYSHVMESTPNRAISLCMYHILQYIVLATAFFSS